MAKTNCPEPDADDAMRGMMQGKMPMQGPQKQSSARPPKGPKAETKIKNALKGKFK